MQNFSFSVSFATSVENLFFTFHEPSMLQQWFAPGDMFVGQVMNNFKVDGNFRVQMNGVEGDQQILLGKYLAIESNKQLAFTWQWQPDGETTQVGLLFKAINESTAELTLNHSGFTDKDNAELHQAVWIACLEKLSILLAQIKATAA